MSISSAMRRVRHLLPSDPPIYVLAALILVFSTSLSIVLPLLPLYATQLKATPAHLGALVSFFVIGRLLAQFPVGYLVDRLGSRRILWSAMGVFLIVSIGYAMSYQVASLLVWRFFQGLASGGMLVAVRSYVNIRASSGARGTANALLTSASNGGELLGPAIGGLLADIYDYRMPFVVLSICIGVLLPCLAFLPRESRQDENQSDAALVKPFPLLSKTLNKRTLFLSVIRFAEMAGFAVWLTVFAPYANTIMKWDSTQIGLTFSVAAAAGLITGPIWGMLSDRIGRHPVLVSGLLLLLIQVTVVLLFPLSGFVWIAFFLGGAGGTGYYDALFAMIGDMTEVGHNTGQVMGAISSIGEVGSAVSPWAASTIWRFGNIQMSFIVNISLLLVALILVLCLPRSMRIIPKDQKGLEV